MKGKRLYRTREDRVLAGICGGLGEYFGYDPVLIRVLAVVLLVLTGLFPLTLIYIIAIFIIPLEPEARSVVHEMR